MRRFVPVIALMLFSQVVPTAEAKIQRVDTCAGQFAPSLVPLRLGIENQTITVRGDLVDTNTRIEAPAGITVRQLESGGGGGLNTFVKLEVGLIANLIPGPRQIKIHYLVEFSGPDVFTVDVRDIRIDSIRMSSPRDATHIVRGTEVFIDAQGDGLSNLQLNAQGRAQFTNVQILQSQTNFSIRGVAQSTFTLTSGNFFDASMNSNGTCAAAHGSGSLTVQVGLPNLVPLAATGIYRLPTFGEECEGTVHIPVDDGICSNPFSSIPAPTTATPHVEGLVRIKPIAFGVINNTEFPMPNRPFRIQLKVGANVLQTERVNPEDFTHGRKIFTFNRPENRRMVMRDLNCPKCFDLRVAPYNWVEPLYTVVVDVDQEIDESNEGDNSRGSN